MLCMFFCNVFGDIYKEQDCDEYLIITNMCLNII